jgi:hypothetical protein
MAGVHATYLALDGFYAWDCCKRYVYYVHQYWSPDPAPTYTP